MNILDALNDRDLFAPHFRGDTWQAWRAFLAALFGLPMDDAALELYRCHTGRQESPAAPFKEAALVIGRRGGKSRVLALIAVFLACFRDYRAHLAPGEVATVAVIAADRRQARSIFRFALGLLRAVDMLAGMIEDETAEDNHAEQPCGGRDSHRFVQGHSRLYLRRSAGGRNRILALRGLRQPRP